MPHRVPKIEDRAVQTSLSFLKSLLGDYHPREFAVRLWDGTVWEPEPGWPARFTLVLKHPGALRNMFWPPGELALAEAYVHGDFDIEGRIEDVFPWRTTSSPGGPPPRSASERSRSAAPWKAAPEPARRPSR